MGDFQINSQQDSGPITIHPDWGFSEKDRALAGEGRTVGGVYRDFKWHDHREFTMPLTFVNCATKFRVNQWWRNMDTIELTLNTSEAASTIICHMVNQTQPIGNLHQPRVDLFQGNLELQAVDASSVQ